MAQNWLIASHIVPWHEDQSNRLNPQNLVLVTHALKRKSADSSLAEALLRFDQQPINLPEQFMMSQVAAE